MFQRHENTYHIDFEKINLAEFLADDASPLVNILNIIPETAKVLDIGAGNGILGWLIKKVKPGIIIDGIEPNRLAGDLATQYYRKFFHSSFQEIKDRIIKEEYDYIVLADVIEHITDPFNFLQDLINGLPESTRIILSIPNVAHYSVRLELLNGNFQYVDSGLLEKTHVRFFTLKTITDLVGNLKMNIESVYFLKRIISLEGINFRLNLSCLSYFKLFNDREALTFQYLLVLGPGSLKMKMAEKGTVTLPKILKSMFVKKTVVLHKMLNE